MKEKKKEVCEAHERQRSPRARLARSLSACSFCLRTSASSISPCPLPLLRTPPQGGEGLLLRQKPKLVVFNLVQTGLQVVNLSSRIVLARSRSKMRKIFALLLSAAATATVSAFAPVAVPAGLQSRARALVPLRRAAPLSLAAKVSAARRVHKAQPSMMAKKVAVGLVGPGLVGGALLKQMESTQATLAANGMDVSVMAIASKKDGKEWMMCREKWITLQEAKDAKWDMGEAGDLKKMAEYLKSKAPNAVIIDTTSAEPVSEMYATWLKVSISQKTSA